MRDGRREVRFDHGHRRWVGGPVVEDDALQLPCGLARGAGLIERFPPPRLDLLVVALRELARDVPQRVDGAALLERLRPELAGCLPDSRCPVGDHERRGAQSPPDHVAPEGEPRVIALAASESQSEQDLPPLERHPPADKNALRWCVVGAQLQVDRVEEEVDDVVLLKAPAAPLPVSLAGVLTDPRDRALRRDRLLEDLLQRRLDIPRRETPKEAADHQRLQSVGTGDALAEDPALEPEPLRITDPRALQAHSPARRLDRPFLIAVAVTDRLTGALIAPAAEKLGDLVLQRLLQDQPGTETTDRLNRVLIAANTGQHHVQFRAEPLDRGYLLHAGVPPSSTCSGSKRRLRPSIQFPRLMGRDRPRALILRLLCRPTDPSACSRLL